MTNYTQSVLQKNRSIEDLEEQLLFKTDGDPNKREAILLKTVQELASVIIAIRKEVEFKN